MPNQGQEPRGNRFHIAKGGGPVLIFLLVVKVGVVESDSVTYHLEVGEFE